MSYTIGSSIHRCPAGSRSAIPVILSRPLLLGQHDAPAAATARALLSCHRNTPAEIPVPLPQVNSLPAKRAHITAKPDRQPHYWFPQHYPREA